jgi:hypothetical protein
MRLSISKIKLFKACRRAYELKYVEGLEPVQTADALQTGLWYHDLIETLYRDGNLSSYEGNYSKEVAMATAYQKYIYPKFKVKACEEWKSYNLMTGDTLIGRLDGIAEDGRLVEHKTTSSDITEEYEYNLQWDEQMLAYMLMTGAREIYYTVCRKPTIRQKKNETDEEFFNRMVEWYDEDTETKIRVMLISRTDAEVEEFMDAVEKMAREMNETSHYYRNTAYCRQWGRMCDYAPICLHYDKDQEYVEFQRKEEEYGDTQI